MELLNSHKIDFFPISGKKFHYTTHGFTLLSGVIEAAAGEPFDKHMKKIFKELGLNNTCLDKHDPLIPNRARYDISRGLRLRRNTHCRF